MALNKTFTCNTIVDENLNDINCWYQGFHVRTKKWNTPRYSEYNQYSCNLGDGDWLTQTGEVFTGDEIILVFWVSAEGERSGIKTRMSSVIVTLTNDSTYITNPQLKPKTIPFCGFSFNDNTPTINNELIAYDFSSDDTEYIYNNVVQYHYKLLRSELIFDSVAIDEIKYDWDEGQGFELINKHTYINIGDYFISQRTTNKYGLSRICSQSIRVKYNAPIPGLRFSYKTPIHTTEDAIIDAVITDEDGRITNINHKIIVREYNDEIISDTIINSNNILNYNYSYTIEVLKKHFFSQLIYWNDGYDDLIINYYKELLITNWCPEVAIIKEDVSPMDKTFIQTSTDKDGTINKYTWIIYFTPPFSTGDYVEVYRENKIDGSPLQIGFTVGGNYKVELIVIDDFNCGVSDSTEFIISAACPEYISRTPSKIKFIFPKQLGND